MGLIDKIKNAFSSSAAEPNKPSAAVFSAKPNTIYAPVNGVVVGLAEVNDECFSAGYFGSGCGVIPQVGILYAPVAGRINATTVTNHAIGMTMMGGVDILMHVGLDTVKMDGKGFTRLVEEGQEVAAGTPLLTFDLPAIKAAGLDEVVTVVVTNYSDFQDVENVTAQGTTIAGRPLVKVGDPMLVVRR